METSLMLREEPQHYPGEQIIGYHRTPSAHHLSPQCPSLVTPVPITGWPLTGPPSHNKVDTLCQLFGGCVGKVYISTSLPDQAIHLCQ